MILCMNCGKLEFYKIKQIVTNVTVYTEDGSPYDTYTVTKEESEPKCLKCGRCVKFFKDANELGGER